MLQEEITELSVADEAQASSSFQRAKWSRFVGLYMPNIDAANVTIEVSLDNSTFVPIQEQYSVGNADSFVYRDAIVVTTGQDPCFADISRIVQSVPRNWYIRLAFSAAQNGGPYTVYVSERGTI